MQDTDGCKFWVNEIYLTRNDKYDDFVVIVTDGFGWM